jgi:RteC protein
MIQKFSEKLYQKLERELEQIAIEVSDPLLKMKTALKPIAFALKQLRNFLNENPFSAKEDEIRFFKYIKPNFYCWQIYFTELYTIESRIPLGETKAQLEHFRKELLYIERFFSQYQFHYQYYKLNANELDDLYFIRGVEIQSVLLPELPDPDPNFSTNSDYLFAKMKAYDMLKDWLEHKIMEIKNPDSKNQNSIDTKLKWTGDTINLLEIAYGWYFTGQINDGKANIIDIVKTIEQVFKVNIGRPYRRLSEIRQRKRLSRTKYIDEMASAITKKLDDEDEYKPAS